jgi:hypothetical protein
MIQQPRPAPMTERLAGLTLDIAVPAVAALATIAVFLMALH